MEQQHIYCISGLGADFRIFEHLQINNAQLHPIEWLMPEPSEKLSSFAKRLSAQIKHENPILLGVSFGGMLATEISKILPVKKVIIVSSNKHHGEFPMYLRAAGKLQIHKLVPYRLVTRSAALNRFIFDTRSKGEELYLKRMMLQDTDLLFIKRAIDMIMSWKSLEAPAGIVHIHGKRDKLLLPSSVNATHWIDRGGHFMIWNEASHVSKIINQLLGG